MTEHTPDTEEVRESYEVRGRLREPEVNDEKAWQAHERRSAEFDRWLNEIRAEAWAEGYQAGQDSVYTSDNEFPSPAFKNPYRPNEK